MLPRIRHERILREVQVHGEVRSSELADKLGVNSVTIRRDINELADAGLLARVHGGALSIDKARRRPAPSRSLVGLLVPSAVSYFPEVVRGMELMAAGRGVRLVLGVSHYDSRIERVQAERLLALGASGLILAPTTAVKPDGVAEWLASLAVPVVLLERMVDGIDVGRQFDSVCSDHVVGCALAVRHLLGLGHRRIRLALYDRTPTAPRLRLGIAEATQRFGLEPAQVEVVPKGEEDPDELVVALRRLLRECRRTGTTAVIAHTDFHAARLVEVAESMDIAVPADLAVIAYDDELADSAIVPLTAVTAPRLEVGRAALAMLLERLDPAGGLEAVRHLQLLPRLTVRQSCGARSEWR